MDRNFLTFKEHITYYRHVNRLGKTKIFNLLDSYLSTRRKKLLTNKYEISDTYIYDVNYSWHEPEFYFADYEWNDV